ncbi:hypothetical protein Tco_0602545 [Tanacetum coccineum]
MAVRTQPTLSLGMSARIEEAAALSPSSFRKRYRSSYKTPSPSSSPTLPIRKRYRGTSELVEDTEDESLDSDTEGEGSEDEVPSLEDKGPGLKDEGPSSEEEEEEEAAPKGQQHAVLVVDTAVNEPLGLGYGALRRQQQMVEETHAPRPPVRAIWVDHVDGTVYTDILIHVPPVRIPVQIPPSPEWSSSSLPVSPSSLAVPTPVASPVIAPAAAIAVDEGEFLEEPGAGARVHFGAIWRPVLALESWARHVDAQRAEMWRAKYDDHRLIHDLLVQNTTMQRELQEMRYRVTILEREGSHRRQWTIWDWLGLLYITKLSSFG